MATPDHWHWNTTIDGPGECAIFDMDGVLADANGRQHLLTWPNRDWGKFFAASGSDELIDESAVLLRCLREALQIVLLTARPLTIRPATLEWLQRHEIPFDLLVMRPEADRRSSLRYKRAAVADLRDVGFVPRIGFEDDIRNVEMLRSEGVPCVYIHSGYYD